MTLRPLQSLCTVVLVLAACADADSGSRRSVPTGPVGAGGQSPASAGATAGGSAGNGFGNAAKPTASQPIGMKPMQPLKPIAGGVMPVSIDACGAGNEAGLSDADAAKLMAGGGSAAGMRFLYPYDGTVFPRGLRAPLLMWEGGAADAVYVHIKAALFEYKGCLKATAAGQLQLPQDAWDTAGLQTKGSSDPYVVELSVIKGATVSGPIALRLTIAQATIKGSIYYNSYSSKLAPQTGGGGFGAPAGGVVLRIPPGGMAEVFLSTECNGCHSVSADGSRLISQYTSTGGRAFELSTTPMADPPGTMAGGRSAFGALYPDGSAYLSTSAVIDVARASLASDRNAAMDAQLYSTDDGSVIPNTGIPKGALMPMFSPGGSLLVFNDYAINMAHGLALMKYDAPTHTASEYRELYKDSDKRPGWPFVLPDDGAVIFTRTDGQDFSGEGAGIAATAGGGFGGTGVAPFSDIYIVDIASGTATILARAMGYATAADAMSATTYLPFGAAELHKSYFPTLSPVAAGGYFWLFFDAVRHYGNLGEGRQLWGAAIEIAPDGSYAVDRSFPAFYLPGQEFGTGNHRAFAALDPCKMNGNTCTSGTDCCGGFCYVAEPTGDVATEQVGMCSSDIPKCAKTNERCTANADCCPPEGGEPPNTCIAGFCAVVGAPM